jgi:hypothetical protein
MPSSTSLSVMWCFTRKHNTSVEASRIFIWFGPSWLFMFPKLRISLKGPRFELLEDTQNNVILVMKWVLENDFKHIEASDRCWPVYIMSEEDILNENTLIKCDKIFLFIESL